MANFIRRLILILGSIALIAGAHADEVFVLASTTSSFTRSRSPTISALAGTSANAIMRVTESTCRTKLCMSAERA